MSIDAVSRSPFHVYVIQRILLKLSLLMAPLFPSIVNNVLLFYIRNI